MARTASRVETNAVNQSRFTRTTKADEDEFERPAASIAAGRSLIVTALGCREANANDAHIDATSSFFADAFEFSCLQHAQQFGLEVDRNLTETTFCKCF